MITMWNTTMTKTQIAETLDALKQTRVQATKSKEAAVTYLQKIGIVDKQGKLAKRYRASKTHKAHEAA